MSVPLTTAPELIRIFDDVLALPYPIDMKNGFIWNEASAVALLTRLTVPEAKILDEPFRVISETASFCETTTGSVLAITWARPEVASSVTKNGSRSSVPSLGLASLRLLNARPIKSGGMLSAALVWM